MKKPKISFLKRMNPFETKKTSRVTKIVRKPRAKRSVKRLSVTGAPSNSRLITNKQKQIAKTAGTYAAGLLILLGLVLFIAFYSSKSHAFEEGFYDSPKGFPEVVQNGWKSTVRIYRFIGNGAGGRDGIVSTGTIVGLNSNNKKAIIMATTHGIRCKTALCQYEIKFNKAVQKNELEGESTVYSDLNEGRFTNKAVEFLLLGFSKDLAFLLVDVPENADIRVADLADLSRDNVNIGENVFLVGSPSLLTRKDTEWRSLSRKPKNVDQVIKRISVGKLVSFQKNYPLRDPRDVEDGIEPARVKDITAILHSADALPGNSGSPLFTESGKLIGMYISASKDKNGNSQYIYCDGSDWNCRQIAISSEEFMPMLQRAKEKVNGSDGALAKNEAQN